MSKHPLAQLTLFRVREFLREPEAVFWAFVFPILLAAGLGIAFRDTPAETVNIAAVSAPIAESLRAEKLLSVREVSAEGGALALRNGQVVLLAEPGPDGGVVYRFDAMNPEARNARILADAAIQRAAGRTDPVAATDKLVSEPGSRYIDFLVPGLVGMGVMGNSIWGLAFSIVDARRRKLLKRIVATPMPRHYYLMSYLAWRLVLLWFEVAVPIGFGVLAFGVPMRGSLVELALLCLLASLAFSSMGLLISTRVKTIEAASGLTNIAIIPMWIVSGVFFSAGRFPDIVQLLIKALPLTAANDAIRANMLQGATLVDSAPQLGVLATWMVVSFVLALKLFRWR